LRTGILTCHLGDDECIFLREVACAHSRAACACMTRVRVYIWFVCAWCLCVARPSRRSTRDECVRNCLLFVCMTPVRVARPWRRSTRGACGGGRRRSPRAS
jgi:hypothetical protein